MNLKFNYLWMMMMIDHIMSLQGINITSTTSTSSKSSLPFNSIQKLIGRVQILLIVIWTQTLASTTEKSLLS